MVKIVSPWLTLVASFLETPQYNSIASRDLIIRHAIRSCAVLSRSNLCIEQGCKNLFTD